MLKMMRYPICTTIHENRYLSNEFNIENYKDPKKYIHTLQDKIYHLSRIFLFSGLRHQDVTEEFVNTIVSDTVFMYNDPIRVKSVYKYDRLGVENFDYNYKQYLMSILKTKEFKSIMKLGRFLQTQISEDFFTNIPGYIVVTIDDLETSLTNDEYKTENYKFKIKLCYYTLKSISPDSIDSNIGHFTTEDLLFNHILRPHDNFITEFILIVSWTCSATKVKYKSDFDIQFEEKDVDNFVCGSDSRVNICQYAMKHILNYVKNGIDHNLKCDQLEIKDGFKLFREYEDDI